MLKILRFLEDFHLALGAGFGLAAAQLEPYTPNVTITLGEES